ncbi:MAG: LuxR C-terminal-related transcriptional regulator [Rhodospirillales bacterium]
MLELYQEYVSEAVVADSVTWLAGYAGMFGQECWKAELLDGWKVIEMIYPPESDKTGKVAYAEYMQFAKTHGIDALTEVALDTTGKTRVVHIDDIDWEKFKTHPEKKKFYERFDIGQRMLGVYHLHEQAESYLIIDRVPGGPPFSGEDRENLYQALCEFPRVHHWLMLERGLVPPAGRPIMPRYQEILKLLQQNLSEKDIAERLNLSAGTVHGYVIDIYKTFNVNSRAELMSLWFQATTTVG